MGFRAPQAHMLVDIPMSPSLMDPDFGKLRHEAVADIPLDLIPEVVRMN